MSACMRTGSKQMKVLVTGVRGQLGYDVCRRLEARKVEHWGIDIQDCDLTDAAQTRSVITQYHPDVVVHCAAYTAVNQAEENEDLCRSVNAGGTRNVALACLEIDAAMAYISTDYVFDGEGTEPFEIDASIAPQSVYGRTKAEGETAVREILTKAFIVRIAWVFGINGNNFVKTMLRLGKEKGSIDVVCDQIGSPTYTDDLARLLCDMIETEKYGTYHATNEGYCSWCEFAQAIMEEAGLKCEVRPILTSAYPSPAKRPLNSRLSKRSLDTAGFTRLPPWRDALHRYIEALK